jgi:hypothetical protein
MNLLHFEREISQRIPGFLRHDDFVDGLYIFRERATAPLEQTHGLHAVFECDATRTDRSVAPHVGKRSPQAGKPACTESFPAGSKA